MKEIHRHKIKNFDSGKNFEKELLKNALKYLVLYNDNVRCE